MEYKHFSHHHTLTLHKVQPGQQFQCHGCHQPCHDSIFACWRCSFFLHDHCGNANRYIKHPSHPLHPLILTPTPTYCSGSFLCNACCAPGTTFSYCCAMCEVDLHVHCTFLPPKAFHNVHPHEMSLSFTTPDRPNYSPSLCKICSKELSSGNWSYSCDKPECDFRAHTSCVTHEVKPGMYQDHGQADPAVDQNTSVYQTHVRTELTPEEEIVLEMNRMHMELQMAQALANIIAYPR